MGGLAFVFLTPPFQVPDEYAHFYRAYDVSEGHLCARISGQRVGAELPKSLGITAGTVAAGLPFHPMRKMNPHELRQALRIPLAPERRSFVDFPNTAITSPLPYAFASSGIALGRFFHFSPIVLMYLGRLANVIAFIGLVALALRLTPGAHWCFVILALMPMTLFEAASLSHDAVSNALAFLWAAWILRLAAAPSVVLTGKRVMITAVLAGLVASSKTVNLLLVALFILIPVERARSHRQFLAYFAVVMTVAFIAWAGWTSTTRDLLSVCEYYDPAFHLGSAQFLDANPDAQVQWLCAHPLKIPGLLWETVRHENLVEGFVGRLGWLDTRFPTWYICLYWVALVGTALFAGPALITWNGWRRGFIAVVCLGVFVLMSLLLYIHCVAPGKPAVYGLQGRHFLALGPWFCLFFENKRLKWKGRDMPCWMPFAALLASVLFALHVTAQRYYF